MLLQIAMQNVNIVIQYIKQHLESELSESQMRELKNVMKYINKMNDARHSWASLLSQIFDNVGPVSRIKDAFTKFFKQ